MRAMLSFLKAVEHSSAILIVTLIIGLFGLFLPENVFVHFGVQVHEFEQIALSALLLILPLTLWMIKSIGIYKRSYPIRHILETPRQIDFDKFAFRAPGSDDELHAFVELSEKDEQIYGSYEEGEIDRTVLYRQWRSWRPDAFLALIKAGHSEVSMESVQAVSIILPLTVAGVAFFRNGGRAANLEAHHVVKKGMPIEGLLLDTWIVLPRGVLEIGGKRRILREHVSRHQNALYLIHMSLFWHTARKIVIIFEASNHKLIKPLCDKGFAKLIPNNKQNKHYYIEIQKADFVHNSFAASILIDLKRFSKLMR